MESTTTKLSIIIPTFNRASLLRMCLDSLIDQSQPAQDFEVIVVVDGSTDGTREMLDQIRTNYSLQVIYQANQGPARARNQSAKFASGRYLLFLDDDIFADRRLVEQHLNAQRENKGAVVVGQLRLEFTARSNWYLLQYQKAWAQHYARLNLKPESISWLDCYGGNLSVPRDAFINLGGFDVGLPRSEDVELGYRLEKSGLKLKYLPSATGVQYLQKTARSLLRDGEVEGMAALALYARHPEMLSNLARDFHRGSWRQTVLKRAMLTAHLPPVLLFWAGSLLGNHRWNDEFFRFSRAYCFWLGVRKKVSSKDFWERLTGEVNILMYHAFTGKDEPVSRYIVSSRCFRRQMQWLRKRGYEVISLGEYVDFRKAFCLPPGRSVVITLDDGYADNYNLAYPILREMGYPATVFIVTGSIGNRNHWDNQPGELLRDRQLLSKEEIQSMAIGGIEFGAHSRSHSRMALLNEQQLLEETAGARADLEKELHIPIRLFSYPYGKFNAETTQAVAAAGYDAACGVSPGRNNPGTSLLALNRSEIQGTDSLIQFALALIFGSDAAIRKRERISIHDNL